MNKDGNNNYAFVIILLCLIIIAFIIIIFMKNDGFIMSDKKSNGSATVAAKISVTQSPLKEENTTNHTTNKPEPTDHITNTYTVSPSPVPLEAGFVYVTDHIEDAIEDMRYFKGNNFMGRRVDGYNANRAILTKEAAEALANAANELRKLGYVLVIYDAYRPTRAVDDFVRWVNDTDDAGDPSYYPGLTKQQILDRQYIAKRSSHSKGSTIDLSICYISDGSAVDMGSTFDMFNSISSFYSDLVSEAQRANRAILRNCMISAGFVPYNEEWWHFTLADQPYPDKYFDFVVE